MKHPARWRVSRGTRRLATAALLALAAALVTGHAAIMLLAAPLLAALAIRPHDRSPRPELDVTASVSASRCFEGEDIELTVGVTAASPLEEAWFLLAPATDTELVSGPARQATAAAGTPQARWVVRPRVWGRRPLGPVRIGCRSLGGTWETEVAVWIKPVDVYPHPPVVRARLVPPDLLRRIGEHTGRAVGEGVEFAAVRPYVPGDRLRDVNWLVSGRRGELHVNQRAAQRAADLIVMIDAFAEVGARADSTIDASVHGAAAVVTAYLRTGDRAGLVVLGGILRWLAPAPGNRHFYRIAELLLSTWYGSEITPDLDRVPRTALPPGALVILFSPLLDERALGALADLRERGFPVVVVDVLRDEPREKHRTRSSELALRIWRLERTALYSGLAAAGIPVIPWGRDDELDAVMAPLRRVPAARGHR